MERIVVNSRAKGARYEREVELWLSSQFGDRITRTNRSGFNGEDFDLDGLVSIEVKNCAKLELSAWLAQADRDAGPDRLPIVLHKKRGSSSVGDDYITLFARDLAALLLLGRQP
jgi:hypothetical protein